VLLCRVNARTGRPEVLLVHKRYTYAFAEFVHGRYPGRAGAARPAEVHRVVAALLDNMTTEELLDVWSLDFGQMWYRIWLSREKRELYSKKHAKFQHTFMRGDGGAALRRAVAQAQSRGALLWEVPKGRHQSQREPDILCAVRELREETGVDKAEYRLLPGAKKRVSYVSAGTRYACTYYVALAGPQLARRGLAGEKRPGSASGPALREISHMGEVSEARWHDIEQVRMLGGPGSRLERLVAPAFRLVKQYLKGRWAARKRSVVLEVALETSSSGLPVPGASGAADQEAEGPCGDAPSATDGAPAAAEPGPETPRGAAQAAGATSTRKNVRRADAAPGAPACARRPSLEWQRPGRRKRRASRSRGSWAKQAHCPPAGPSPSGAARQPPLRCVPA
jgi:8-oxo-dGTP pyrophosphatase MutT (NUDIX family)